MVSVTCVLYSIISGGHTGLSVGLKGTVVIRQDCDLCISPVSRQRCVEPQRFIAPCLQHYVTMQLSELLLYNLDQLPSL